MRRPVRIVSLALLLLLPLLAGCEGLKDLQQLMTSLNKEFPGGQINVNRNNNTLAITLLNHPLGAVEDQQAAAARRVAEHVRDHYGPYADLSSIGVRFGTFKGTSGLNTTRTGPAFTFTPRELGAAPAALPATAPSGG